MTSCTPLRPIVSTAAPPAQLAVPVKLSSDTGLFKFWQQETPAARLERDQRGFEALRRTNEQRQLAGERASAVAKAMIASNSAERVRKHRAAKLALRVASGFKPNQKRVSIAFACNHKDIYSQKFQKRMEEYETTAKGSDLAELSRPRRQFREDERSQKKPQGRKRQSSQQKAQRVNWHVPFLWSQIEMAVLHAGRPWSPRAILREAQKLDGKAFARLTEQVIGKWIDPMAKARGVSQWTDSVLAQAATGNSPGGTNTRKGMLVRFLQ